MSRQVRSWSPLSRGILVSIVLHGGIVILLSLKPRVVTLTIRPESGLMQATLIAVPTNQLGQPLHAPKASQQSAEQPPRRVEQPLRPAEKPPLKRAKAEKNSPTIEPSKDSTTGQLVKAAQAPPPPLKQATAPTQKKVKGTLVEGSASPTNKSDGKTASAMTPQTSDLDHFFGHLAASSGTGTAQLASTQQCNHYASQIKSAIQANLIKEPGYQGKSCEIALQLAADGTIVRAEARQGDRLVCAAALRAVGITERVPKPPDSALYERFKAMVISFEF